MEIEWGEQERIRLKKKIDQFSAEQLESLQNYITMIENKTSDHMAPEGSFVNAFMMMQTERTGERSMRATIPIRWEMYNGRGTMHGGMTAMFIDTAMGYTLDACYPGALAGQATVDLTIHYLKGAKGSRLIADSELIQAGRTIAVLDCSVRDDQGDLVSKATGTFKVWLK